MLEEDKYSPIHEEAMHNTSTVQHKTCSQSEWLKCPFVVACPDECLSED